MINETVRAEEAAQLMGVHPETLKKMCIDGAIPAAKIGKAWVIMRRDVLAFVERQVIEQTKRRRGGSGRNVRRVA
jgi:excisionase family DNA binding protein